MKFHAKVHLSTDTTKQLSHKFGFSTSNLYLCRQKKKTPMLKQLTRYYPLAVIVLSALACFVFFQYWYPYHFFYQEQNQLFLWSWDYIATYFDKPGYVARLFGDFLTQFYYYLYAGAAILSLCLLLVSALLYWTLRNFHANKPLALIAALLVMALLSVCHFSTSYRLSSTISIMGWILTLWGISFLQGWKKRIIITVIALLPAYLLFGLPVINKLKTPDFILEKDFAVDNEYYFGNTHKVIDIVKASPCRTDAMLLFYNLVWAQRGELADHLFDFTPNYLGTFEKIGPHAPMLTIRNMNELYWALGDMTFTERAAMMTNVFSPDNRNVRMMKRLAECNLVSGDSLAAEKYLRILDKTLVYREWSANARRNPLYAQKAQLVNHHDTVTISDNAHFLMMQLLDAHPHNTVALDYILCSTLLLKDIESFKRDYDRYCTEQPRIKRLYQEALCIWLAGTNASQEEWKKYIKDIKVFQRFQQYNRQRGNSAFKDTYWYYFDKVKAPEI